MDAQLVTTTKSSFYTRGYSGGLAGPVGPTIRVRPGETLHIILHNKLTLPNPDCKATKSHICQLNTTNLHTHGLHVSGKPGEDNVFVSVEPRQTQELRIKLPADHMGGIHWYHPHHHHSTAAQAGNGAAGVIIVDDVPGAIPDENGNMNEHILIISMINLNTIKRILTSGQDKLVKTTEDTNLVYVNGQFEPTVKVRSGEWNRFRMVFSSIIQTLSMAVSDGDGSCEIQLLAKDGVYLSELPRKVDTISLFPGARSDVAIRCRCKASQQRCDMRFDSTDPSQPADEASQSKSAGTSHSVWQGRMFHLAVEGPSVESEDLPKTRVHPPCYLADLTNVQIDPAYKHTLSLSGRHLTWDNGLAEQMEHMPAEATSEDALASIEGGSVIEMRVSGARLHPFHMHVHHFQVMDWADVGPASHNGDYYLDGDWHDTVFEATNSGTPVRFQTDRFAGECVLHCHFLEHEDQGMMGYLWINGDDGREWPGAATHDPTCYGSKDNNNRPGFTRVNK